VSRFVIHTYIMACGPFIRYSSHYLSASTRGGDCHTAFLPHRECVCYDRCLRCSVEFELDVNFDKFNATRPDQERDLPLTVTSRNLVRSCVSFDQRQLSFAANQIPISLVLSCHPDIQQHTGRTRPLPQRRRTR
jgi:hypothetical protein